MNKTRRRLHNKSAPFLSVSALVLTAYLLPFLKTRLSADNSQKPAVHLKITQRLQERILAPLDPDEHLKVWIYFQDKGITSQ